MTPEKPLLPVALPRIVSSQEWLAARLELLAKEKELTRARDALNAQRRRLPMVEVEKDYVFEGPNGPLRLIDLFEDRRQLYVHHFMWIDALGQGCPSCSLAADLSFDNPVNQAELQERDVTFACISRAPFAQIADYKRHRGWSFPWYSSHGSDFNYDFHATFDASKGSTVYNYRGKDDWLQRGMPEELLNGDQPAASVFLRHGSKVYHAYSAFARGLEQLFMPFNFLDLTPYGRQQEWEDSPEGWPQRPTYG